MHALKDRGAALEGFYAHERELEFKARARRNLALGRWAGERLGLAPEGAEAYGVALVAADVAGHGEQSVFERLRADFHASGLPHSGLWLQRRMDAMLESEERRLREIG
jgi:hypothetical protein